MKTGARHESERFFSPSYLVARQRFRKAATSTGAALTQHPIKTTEPNQNLTIDVATIGSSDPTWTVVITSGLHGIEGFFGSAIQLAWLTQRATRRPQKARGAVVLVHAVNPYGFACLRRTNEDNIDLNRNFLDSHESYTGAPGGYQALARFINPASPPTHREFFRLKALWFISRFGLPALKDAVASGQYRYPQGLFFGGHGPASSTRVIQHYLPKWIGRSLSTLHVDLHSGLGRYGQHRLLLEKSERPSEIGWYRDVFGDDVVEPAAGQRGTAYDTSGTLGQWAIRHLRKDYRFVTAEFGTYSIMRVLSALRAENRACFFDHPATGAYMTAKNNLLECFCPSSHRWRTQVITQGLAIIDRSVRAQTMTEPASHPRNSELGGN